LDGQVCKAAVEEHRALISVNASSQHLYRATSSH
jgi:hypothetical protein